MRNIFVMFLCLTGFMHFWGLQIDIATALFLIIGTGLAVDYSSHIAHCFMLTNHPSRNERIKSTILQMGPPVFNGGFSTFLAFVLLADSEIQIYVVFFRIFFLVVWCGLYNGLVLMPVVLSLIGPKAVITDAKFYMKIAEEID